MKAKQQPRLKPRLRRCPFCGTNGKLRKVNYSILRARIECEECTAVGPMAQTTVDAIMLDDVDAVLLAIKSWNRRAKLPAKGKGK